MFLVVNIVNSDTLFLINLGGAYLFGQVLSNNAHVFFKKNH
jgi:hypothetical protein